MRKVYSHGASHSYSDTATHQEWGIPTNGWNEIPDDVAAEILPVHRNKLCDVTDEADPSAHRCSTTVRLERELAKSARNAPPNLVVTEEDRPIIPMRKRRAAMSALRRNRNAREAWALGVETQ